MKEQTLSAIQTYPIIPMRFDRSILDLMILPQARRDEITRICRDLGLSHGDVARCVDLAFQCASQCLREPVRFGTRVSKAARTDGVHIVVGTKPNRFEERFVMRSKDRRPIAFPDLGGEALVWTVDPTSSRPGISQSRWCDWNVI